VPIREQYRSASGENKLRKEREKQGELEGGDTTICVVHTVGESETHYVA